MGVLESDVICQALHLFAQRIHGDEQAPR